jgi:ribonuclease HII
MPRQPKIAKVPLQIFRNEDPEILEIGIDEAGRGPLFGRLYVAGVILPKDNSFRHELMSDSKKIHNRKKMLELSNLIKSEAIAWHIEYVESSVIDQINIRQAVLMAMHECAKQLIDKTPNRRHALLVDGNDFTPHTTFNSETQQIETVPFETIEGGDNTYTCIAAASILAKHERDTYMEELCSQYPILDQYYGLSKNMGYGTKTHRDGIATYGITQWHRKTYGICKESVVNTIV